MKQPLLALLYLGALAFVAFAVYRALLYRDRRRVRKAVERKRPQVQALLDEMIALVKGWEGPLPELVLENSRSKDISDSRTTATRSVSLHPDRSKPRNERRSYSLSVQTKPAKKTGESVNITLHVVRDEESLHLYYPDLFPDDGPLEPWLVERLDVLFALVGDASGWREMEKKMDAARRRLDERLKKSPPASN